MAKQRIPQPNASWKRAFINAFIIVHLYIIAVWGLPGSRFRSALTEPVEDYVIEMGLWHSWAMFAPDPLSVNFTVEAEVTFADGTSTLWEFPRMEKLGLWEKYHKERFRKWRERVRQDAHNNIWNDTTRFIARKFNNPTNPPTRVVLIRRWAPIPPPDMLINPNDPGKPKIKDFQPMPDEYTFVHQYRFKHYEVRPEDLQ